MFVVCFLGQIFDLLKKFCQNSTCRSKSFIMQGCMTVGLDKQQQNKQLKLFVILQDSQGTSCTWHQNSDLRVAVFERVLHILEQRSVLS